MKTALIVDDSRVARAVLRKILVEFGIDVDESPSAEAAIEHLRFESPDVIFLDHMMPGMDGFEALNALKANPRTATIPVLMYTTQEGQLYMSQARALGAVDILPKNLAPADVERILRSHHLIGEPRWNLIDGNAPEADAHDDLIAQFRTMLDEQAAMLMSDFRRELRQVQAASEAAIHEVSQATERNAAQSFSRPLALGSIVGTLALVAAIGFPYLPDNETSSLHVEPPVTVAKESDTGFAPVELAPPAQTQAQPSQPETVATLAGEWAATHPYAYGAVPLDDRRAREYALLFARLKSDGFRGTVTFEIHQGRHCVSYADDGSVRLAPPDQPAVSCAHIGTPNSGGAAPLQSSIFNDLVASANRDGQIRVETVRMGSAEPIIDYPALDYSVTAADWNSIADINQRVLVRVSGDRADALREAVAYLGD